MGFFYTPFDVYSTPKTSVKIFWGVKLWCNFRCKKIQRVLKELSFITCNINKYMLEIMEIFCILSPERAQRVTYFFTIIPIPTTEPTTPPTSEITDDDNLLFITILSINKNINNSYSIMLNTISYNYMLLNFYEMFESPLINTYKFEIESIIQIKMLYIVIMINACNFEI